MANESIKINEYCYSLVLKKFTEGVNLEQAGCVARWSPNNLRRIIISPDGVLHSILQRVEHIQINYYNQ